MSYTSHTVTAFFRTSHIVTALNSRKHELSKIKGQVTERKKEKEKDGLVLPFYLHETEVQGSGLEIYQEN